MRRQRLVGSHARNGSVETRKRDRDDDGCDGKVSGCSTDQRLVAVRSGDGLGGSRRHRSWQLGIEFVERVSDMVLLEAVGKRDMDCVGGFHECLPYR
jgi:hypothetical protein